jgi:polysaccharide export outer membrane protein
VENDGRPVNLHKPGKFYDARSGAMAGRCQIHVLMGLLTAVGLMATGCASQQLQVPADPQMPRELNKVTMPPYVIEPPDILLIDATRVIPKPPYHVEPLDILYIYCPEAPADIPGAGVQGVYPVEPAGTVNLGPVYGSVKLAGMTLEEARVAIEKVLKDAKVLQPHTQVSVAQSRALQQIRGQHLVRPDGNVSMGNYGQVYVTGMTTGAAKAAIEAQLSNYLEKPEVSVDILAFNSKVFYVITDGGGFGQGVNRLPITGNETVLDAIAAINGLPQQASKKKIWIARPAPAGACGGDQILPINWKAITMCGETDTNYQILPGDRIFVKADGLIAIDNWLGKFLAPIERILSDVGLGAGVVNSVSTIGHFGVGQTGGGNTVNVVR